MTTQYYYGGFAIHDGQHYFITSKDDSLPSFSQTVFQVARFEGVKKTGERVNSKQIPVTLQVIASSRADLESKLDALYAALSMRQQQLTLHASDGRYFVADCVDAKASLVAGRPASADVACTFVAQQPFAYAASASAFDSGSMVMPTAGTSTTWQLPSATNPQNISGAGNTFARPTIILTNQTATNATTTTAGLTNGVAATTISIAALPAAAASGSVFLLVSGTHSQRVTLSAPALLGATSLSVTSFTPNFSYPSSSQCVLDIYVQAIQLSQNPDGNVLAVSNLGVQEVGNGQNLTINCDPISSTNGYTCISSSDGLLNGFVGSFPVMQPGTTQFSLIVTCSNQPTIRMQITWIPRWRS